jgi:hypothetical protein
MCVSLCCQSWFKGLSFEALKLFFMALIVVGRRFCFFQCVPLVMAI